VGNFPVYINDPVMTRLLNKSGIKQWPNKILYLAHIKPGEVLFHPKAMYIHPGIQQTGLLNILETIGWVAPVLISARTNYLLDGQLRAEMADLAGQGNIPALILDLTEEEEDAVVLTYNAIGKRAVLDNELPGYMSHNGLKVITPGPSKAEEFITDAKTAGGKVAVLIQKLLALNILRYGKEERSRTTSRKLSIEHLPEVQFQSAKHNRVVYRLGGPESTVRIYGSREEVEAYIDMAHSDLYEKVS
jgi:hypothetical protein